jgi:hypothetical protein
MRFDSWRCLFSWKALGALTPSDSRKLSPRSKRPPNLSSRELFQPLRLALAGRAGGGELDRVILLVDEAAAAVVAAKVKTVRERTLEFCAALD